MLRSGARRRLATQVAIPTALLHQEVELVARLSYVRKRCLRGWLPQHKGDGHVSCFSNDFISSRVYGRMHRGPMLAFCSQCFTIRMTT